MSGVLKKDDNGYPVAGGVSSSDANVVLPFEIDPATGRLLTDSASGGGTGTWYDVAGTIDGSNVTFTIATEAMSDFLLFFERQPQMETDDFTYVAAAGSTTITYVAGHQPFNGATLHKAFVIS
jgi:hypothetical protein